MRMFSSWKSANLPRSPQGFAPALVVAGLLLASQAVAVDLPDTVQLHGFASQAYVKTTANKYFGNSDKGSFDFRELGVNLSWQALPSLQLAAQVGSRKAGGNEINANPRFDYAVADFTPLRDEHGRAGLRAGRYRIPLGLWNLTRDVANTRPSIFLPESIYSDASRHTVLAMDGAEVYGEARTAIGDFFFDYGAGKFILDDREKQAATATNSSVWRLLYEHDAGLIRLAVTKADVNLDVILPPFANPKANANIYLYSAQYNAEQWSLTGEYAPDAIATISGLVIPGIPGVFPDTVLPDIVQKSEAYYLQGTYLIARNWEALLRYDVHYRDKSDRSGVRHATATVPAYSFFTKDLTVGIGWNVRPDTKIRAEYHRVNGTGWLSARENPISLNTKQYWDMFVLQASYNF